MIDVKNSPPFKLLKTLKYFYPDIFDRVDAKAKLKKWPGFVYCPISEICKIFEDVQPNSAKKLISDIAIIAAVSGWRQAKTIYDFDATLTSDLYDQATDKISVSSDMLRLPSWSIYIKPNDDTQFDGMFVSFDFFEGVSEIRFLPVLPSGKCRGVVYMTLSQEPVKISDLIDETAAEFDNPKFIDEIKNFNAPRLAQWINLLLYISASNADIKRDTNHFFRRSKKISDTPKEVDYLNVGKSVGYRLRTLHSHISISPPGTGHHRSPIMHIRRAHWHTYYIGQGRKKSEIKWLPPIIVNQDGKPSDLTTIFKVR